MSFRQCVLASSIAILALELAIPATLFVFKMAIAARRVVGPRSQVVSQPREDPPPHEAALGTRAGNDTAQSVYSSERGSIASAKVNDSALGANNRQAGRSNAGRNRRQRNVR